MKFCGLSSCSWMYLDDGLVVVLRILRLPSNFELLEDVGSMEMFYSYCAANVKNQLLPSRWLFSSFVNDSF